MRKSAGNNNNIFACVVKGTLWGIACGAVSLLIFAAIGLSLPDPEKYSAPLALAALFISAFVGAFLSARKCGDGGLRAGLFSGVLFLLVLALAALRDVDKTAYVCHMCRSDTCHLGFCRHFGRKS